MESYNTYSTRVLEFCENDTIWFRFNTLDSQIYWIEDGREKMTDLFILNLDDSDLFRASLKLSTTNYKFGSDMIYKKTEGVFDTRKATIKLLKKPVDQSQNNNNAYDVLKNISRLLDKINNIKVAFEKTEKLIYYGLENNFTGNVGARVRNDRNYSNKYEQKSTMKVDIKEWNVVDDSFTSASLDLTLQFLSIGWEGEPTSVSLTASNSLLTVISDLPVPFELRVNHNAAIQNIYNYFYRKGGHMASKDEWTIYGNSFDGNSVNYGTTLTLKTSSEGNGLIAFETYNGWNSDVSFGFYSNMDDGLWYDINTKTENIKNIGGVESFTFTPYWIL